MADLPVLQSILTGSIDLNSLPNHQSRIVRIFLSSTFTDMIIERNMLMERAFPRLKELCREKFGLEFQVVDMRWGVRDEATDDHSTVRMCEREIVNCQRMSIGPSFVVFLGQKYGYRPAPAVIAAEEFEMIMRESDMSDNESQLLTLWYKRDDNALSPVYLLQPISSVLRNFNNKVKLMERDKLEWQDTVAKLQNILRRCVQQLLNRHLMTDAQTQIYIESVTEQEIKKGLMKPEFSQSSYAFIRNITNMDTDISKLKYASRYTDFKNGSVDKEAVDLMHRLRDISLPQYLPAANISRYTIQWKPPRGMDTSYHSSYLHDLSEKFCTDLSDSIAATMARFRRLPSLHDEILHHLHTCRNLSTRFHGRQELLNQLREYIQHTPQHAPLVLVGQSGCGMSSIIAKAFEQTRQWLAASLISSSVSTHILVRFIGTSPQSFETVGTLRSLCKQLALCADQSTDCMPEDVAKLGEKFKQLLALVAEKNFLVIYLDGIDMLYYSSNQQHESILEWLPTVLPTNVRLVLSVIPEMVGIVDSLQKVIRPQSQFVFVSALNSDACHDILQVWLAERQRTLSASQWTAVNEAVLSCKLPLQLRLVFNEVCGWHSYDAAKLLTVTVNKGIMRLLEQMEERHGKLLVSHALGLITTTRNGLSESELDDLLSLDDAVLNDVYQYFLPPISRIPPLLWARLHNDLIEYFTERQADDVVVIAWLHRQFEEVASERYFRNVNFKSEIHNHLCEYFLGVWAGGKKKPFEISEEKRHRFGLESTKGETDRKVSLQPFVYKSPTGQIIGYNKRKLNELPYHLIRCYRYTDLFNHVLFNFDWLYYKLSCMPLFTILDDFDDALNHKYDQEIVLVRDAIRLSASMLRNRAHMLAAEIVGRLLPYYNYFPNIRQLIQDCDTKSIHVNGLVPAHHYLQAPGGPLLYSLEEHSLTPYGVVMATAAHRLISAARKLIVWDLLTGYTVREFNLNIEGVVKQLFLTNDNLLAVGYTSKNIIVLCNIMSGEKILWPPLAELESSDILGMCLLADSVCVWTAHGCCQYSLQQKLILQYHVDNRSEPLVDVHMLADGDKCCLIRSRSMGDENTAEHFFLIMCNAHDQRLFFSNAYVFSGNTAYLCNSSDTTIIERYIFVDNVWQHKNIAGQTSEAIHALHLSDNADCLAATVATGYHVWHLVSGRQARMDLPASVSNFFTKARFRHLVSFSRRNDFLITAVKSTIFIFDSIKGNLVKVFQSHIARILRLLTVHTSLTDIVMSVSSDTTIKVWDISKIFNESYHIDKMEKAVEQIMITDGDFAFSLTQGQVGLWDTLHAKLIKTFKFELRAQTALFAAVTRDGRCLVVKETSRVTVWQINTSKVIRTLPLAHAKHIVLVDDDHLMFVYQPTDQDMNKNKTTSCEWKVTYFSLQAGLDNYTLTLTADDVVHCVLSADCSLLVLGYMHKNKYTLVYYHIATGTKMDEMIPKYANIKPVSKLVVMPNSEAGLLVALIDLDKGTLINLTRKVCVRSIVGWNGTHSQDGSMGLNAPEVAGGLAVLSLTTGHTLLTLLPKAALGAFSVLTCFTSQGHVIYYNSCLQTIFTFRSTTGEKLAEFKFHYAVRSLNVTADGNVLLVGGVDGSVTALAIVDVAKQQSREHFAKLRRRYLGNDQRPPLRRGTSLALNFSLMSAQYKFKHVVLQQQQASRTCAVM